MPPRTVNNNPSFRGRQLVMAPPIQLEVSLFGQVGRECPLPLPLSRMAGEGRKSARPVAPLSRHAGEGSGEREKDSK